ncbi:MAG: hypothetical protein QXR53_03935 [Candidatus Norongarragalinales archaeon]
MKNAVCFLVFALFLSAASASTLKGTVFDSGLQPTRAIVTVNTTPKQTLVAQNGSYSFEVPQGVFKLTATAGNQSVSETVSIVSDGVFNMDMVLLGFDAPSLDIPIVSEESDLGSVTNGNGQPQPNAGFDWNGAIIPLAVLALAVMLFLFHREFRKTLGEVKTLQKNAFRQKRPQAALKQENTVQTQGLSELQQEIVKELQKSEGRMNQKDLRKLLPFSEAKISIELDFLEEKGVVKRFKKGRGNVIVLSPKKK